MSFTHRNSQTNSGSGTSLVITKPTGTAVGDLLVAVIGKDDDPAITGPSNTNAWTVERAGTGTATGNDHSWWIGWKVVTSDDSGLSSFTWTGDSETWSGTISCFTPGNSNPALEEISTAVLRENDATPISNTITAATAGNLLIGGCISAQAATGGLGSTSTGYTLGGNPTTGTANGDNGSILAYKLSATGGETTYEASNAETTAESHAFILQFSDISLTSPELEQKAFRFRDSDVTLNSTTWAANLNTDLTDIDVTDGDVALRLRILLQNDGDEALLSTADYTLRYRVNAGSWGDIGTGTGVDTDLSTNYANGDATTQLLGSGTFATGDGVEGSAVADGRACAIASEIEHEWAISLTSADLEHGDDIDFLVYYREDAETYVAAETLTQTPSISIKKDHYIYPEVLGDTTVYEPTQQSVLQPNIVDNTVVVYEPVQVYLELSIPAIDAAATIHEPAGIDRTLPVPLLNIPATVHEPKAVTKITITAVIDVTPTVYEPTNISHDIPLLDAAPTIHEPASINRTVPIPLLDASPTFHIPLRYRPKQIAFPVTLPHPFRADLIGMPSIDATITVWEPQRLIFQEIFPDAIDASPTFYEPTLHRTLPVPAIPSGHTVHEPAQVDHQLNIPAIPTGHVVHEPVAASAFTVEADAIDNTVVVHEPIIEIPWPIVIDATISETIVHEPVAAATISVDFDIVDNTIAVYEPTAATTYDVTVGAIASTTFVWEPSQSGTAAIFLLPISETLIHEPTAETTVNVPIETLDNSIVVHAFEITLPDYNLVPDGIPTANEVFEPEINLPPFVRQIPLLDAAPVIHEPTLTFGQVAVELPEFTPETVVYEPAQVDHLLHVPVLDASPTIHDQHVAPIFPVVVDLIGSTVVVYEPVQVHHQIPVPHLDASATIFEPSPWLTVRAEHVAATTVVHEPTMQAVVSLETIDASPTIHNQSVQTAISPSAIDASATFHDFSFLLTSTISLDAVIDAQATLWPPGFDKITFIRPGLIFETLVRLPTVERETWIVTPDAVTATTTVLEPTLSATASIVPNPIAETAVHEPTMQAVVSIGAVIDAEPTVHTPTQTNSATITPELLTGTVYYEPGIFRTGFLTPPTPDFSPAIHEPTVAPGSVSAVIGTVIDETVVYEPVQVYHKIPLSAIDAAPTVHEPAATTIISPELLTGTAVHEPVAQAVIALDFPSISVSALLHEPGFSLSSDVFAPEVPSTIVVHEPSALPQPVTVEPELFPVTDVYEPDLATTYLAEPTTIYFGWTYEPSVDFSNLVTVDHVGPLSGVFPPSSGSTVIVPLIDVSVTVEDIVVAATIDAPIPHIASTVVVHEPVTDFYNTVTLETIEGTVLYEPDAVQNVHADVIESISSVFEPNVLQNVHVNTIYSPATVLEPSVAPIVGVGPISELTVVYEPVAYDYYPLPLPAVAGAALVHEPVAAAFNYVPLSTISLVSVYAPGMASGENLLPPHIDASPEVYEPVIETAWAISVETTISQTAVHDPALETTFIAQIPFVSSVPAVFQPTFGLTNTVTVETISIGVVHEPAAYAVNPVTVETIDVTPTVYEPAQLAQTLHLSVINVGTVHAFGTLSLFAVVPTIETTLVVYEPAIDFTYRISLGIDEPAVQVFEPTTRLFVEVPHKPPEKQIYEPSVGFYNTVAPETIELGVVHDPRIIANEVYVDVPLIPPLPTVHDPAVIANVSVPIIVGSATVYGPTMTLFAPLEVIGFKLGLNQETSFILS